MHKQSPEWAPHLEEELHNDFEMRMIRRMFNELCRLSTTGKYSETFAVTERGTILLTSRFDDLAPPLLLNIFHSNERQPEGPRTEEFYGFIRELESKLHGFQFSVEENRENRWIKYTVSKGK